jgi:2-keto-4-pentenoate hydratase/2-oxohepta-3-ene-1,7-dioic acid hydratase in catechol pathway
MRKCSLANAARQLNFPARCSMKPEPAGNSVKQDREAGTMKLVRYGARGQEKPGLIDQSGHLRDLSSHVKDLTGEAYSPASLNKLAALDPTSLPAVPGTPRLGPPVTGISKFVAIGLNYVDHAKETGAQIPTEPIFFLKANTALSGPADPVEKPRGSTKLDWEVEIAAIIGTRAKYVSETEALNHVAGYCVCNDVSERNFQIERLGQWTKGKSHDTFGPLGPWLVTRDEIPDVQKLSMWLDVNGQRRQTGSTSTMIFSMAQCIAYVSQFLTLLPGDVITTGTPPGVGTGMKPPQFLNVGDVVTLGIEGLGEQRQQIIEA